MAVGAYSTDPRFASIGDASPTGRLRLATLCGAQSTSQPGPMAAWTACFIHLHMRLRSRSAPAALASACMWREPTAAMSWSS